MFNPKDFTPGITPPCESKKVFFRKDATGINQNYCWVYTQHKRHLTHKRGVDVIVLNNDIVVIIEFNGTEVVMDTTSVPLKEVKRRLDAGDSIVSLCDLNHTEIVKGGLEIRNILDLYNTLEI